MSRIRLNQFYGSGLPILLRNKAPRYLFKSNIHSNTTLWSVNRTLRSRLVYQSPLSAAVYSQAWWLLIQHSKMYFGIYAPGTDALGVPWGDVGDWDRPARAHDQKNRNQALVQVEPPPPGTWHQKVLHEYWPQEVQPVQQDWDQGWMNPKLGQWIWNPGPIHGDEGDELFLKGWILVQGFFEWGTCLSWHVQRTLAGGLFWRAVLWRRNGREWLVTSVLQDTIPCADHWKIQHWMIHT